MNYQTARDHGRATPGSQALRPGDAAGRDKGRAIRLRRGSQAVLCGLLTAAAMAIGPSAWAPHAAPDSPVIRSVIFSGSASNPTITIRGAHFGTRPPHDPGCHPAGFFRCGSYTGYDFGTALYLVDKTGRRPFSAGRYRPRIEELDAVSFIVTRYSDSVIVLHFGNYYRLVGMPQFHWRLSARDLVTVAVRGSTRSVTVRYCAFSRGGDRHLPGSGVGEPRARPAPRR